MLSNHSWAKKQKSTDMITLTSQNPSREGKQRSYDVINSRVGIPTQKAQSVRSSLEIFELLFDKNMFGLTLDKINIRIADGMNTLRQNKNYMTATGLEPTTT